MSEPASEKWIPVEKQLPPDHVKVLCLGVKNGMFIGACYHPYRPGSILGETRKTEWYSVGRYCPKVVMWTPLPPIPRKDDERNGRK